MILSTYLRLPTRQEEFLIRARSYQLTNQGQMILILLVGLPFLRLEQVIAGDQLEYCAGKTPHVCGLIVF